MLLPSLGANDSLLLIHLFDPSPVLLQSREQTAAHLVANRSTGAAVALIKTVLMHAKQDLRLTKDNVSTVATNPHLLLL